MRKIILSVIIVFAMLVSMNSGTYAASDTNYIQDQELLIKAFSNILEIVSKGEHNYHNEYAGAFIENGLLNICLTDINEEIKDKYIRASGSEVNIAFVLKEYNLNYLEELAEQIRAMKNDDILTVSVVQKSNTVVLGTDKDVKKVKNDVLDKLPLTLSSGNSTNIPITVKYQNPGMHDYDETNYSLMAQYAIPSLIGGIALSSNGSGFTLGICGKYNGNSAVLTCGHGQAVGQSVTANGTVIGTVVKVNYSSYGYYDYSIVRLNSSAASKVTKKVKTQSSTQTISSINQTSIEGMTVKRYGRTSGYKTGVVISTNMSGTFNGNVCYGLVEVSSDSTPQPGDSGGPVYYGSNLYGIIKGYISSGVWYYSPSGAVTGFSL